MNGSSPCLQAWEWQHLFWGRSMRHQLCGRIPNGVASSQEESLLERLTWRQMCFLYWWIMPWLDTSYKERQSGISLWAYGHTVGTGRTLQFHIFNSWRSLSSRATQFYERLLVHQSPEKNDGKHEKESTFGSQWWALSSISTRSSQRGTQHLRIFL